MAKLVLVGDGGGAMVPIQSTFYWLLENEVYKKYGIYLQDIVDMVAGTSAGAIVHGCFAAGASYNTIQDMILNNLKRGFYRGWKNYLPKTPKYNREKVLMPKIREIIETFGIDNIAKTKIKALISSVDIATSYPIFFKSWEMELERELSFCIQCSFSASVYFDYTFEEITKTVYGDGGEGVDNCPFEEAVDEVKKLGWMNNEKVYFISCGCGYSDENSKKSKQEVFDSYKNRFSWLQALDFLPIARRQADDEQFRHAEVDKKTISMLNDNFRFSRVDIRVDEKYDGMDKTQYINEYINFGKQMYAQFKDEIMMNIDVILKEKGLVK